MKQTCRAAYARNVERNTTVKRKPVGHFQRKLSFRQLKANLERTWSGISYWSISLFHKWRASCSIVFILIRPAARILEQMFFRILYIVVRLESFFDAKQNNHYFMMRCILSITTRGYSEKIRVFHYRSRTYDLPITSSDALPLSYGRLVGARIRGYSEKPSAPLQKSTFRLLVWMLCH